jgi:hypothetical protein
MQCAGCLHRDRDQLDAEMVKGTPYRTLGATFGLSLGALSRHRRHIKEMLAARGPAETSEHGSALLARVEEVITEAKAILTEARANKSFGPATQALNSITRALELCARLSGELQSANAGGLQLHLHKHEHVTNNYMDEREFALLIQEATRNFNPDEISRLRLLAESATALTQP